MKRSRVMRNSRQDIEIQTICFSEGKELKLYEGPGLDAVFVDIELDGEEENGIEIAKWINFNWPECQVIFLTNYHSFIMDSYDADHYFYLLKSRMQSYLPELLKKIQTQAESNEQRYAFKLIGNETQYAVISASEILYFERNGRKTRIVCKEQECWTWEKISEIYERIGHNLFLRCHNSYIVNLSHIQKISKEEIRMMDENVIKISRAYRKITSEAFVKWAGERR